MKPKLVLILQRLNGWRLGVLVTSGTILSAVAVVSAMNLALTGEITAGYLLTGLVAAGIVAPVSLYVLGYLLEEIARHQRQALSNSVDSAEARLQAMLDASDEGVLMVTRDGRVLSANKRFLELFCIPPQLAAAGQESALLAYVTGQMVNADEFLTQMRQLCGSDIDARDTLPLRDGRLLARYTRALSFGNERGRICCFKDITEQTNTQAALAEREEVYRSIVSQAGDGIDLVDVDTLRFVEVNDAACRMLGYRRAELLQMRLVEIQADLDEAALREGIARLLPDGNTSLEARHRCKDGSILDVQLNVQAIRLHGRNHLVAVWRDISGQKRAAAEIRAAQGKLQATLDAIPDLLFEVGEDGRIHDYHSPRAELLAAPPEVFLGRIFVDILAPEPAQACMSALREAQETGHSTGRQYELQLPQGKHWFELSVSRKPVSAGEEARFIMLARDITERKRIEGELRQKERYQRALLDNFPFAVWLKDTDSRFLSVNAGFVRVFGASSADELVGKNDFDIAPPAMAEGYRADDRAVLESRTKKNVEEEILTEGTRKWFETYKAPVVDENGEVLGTVGFARDITERKLAEQSMRIAATAFESQEGMLITDANRVIVRVNPAFSAITGYSAEEVVGLTPKLLRSGRHDAAFYAEMMESVELNGTWRGEIWNRRKNGEVYPEWLTISAVKNDQGDVTHYIAALIDITARKVAEDEIRYLAFYDPLTQLPNRRLMLDRLRQALTSSARHHQHGALMLIDMDNFKTLNDTLGHDVGDQLLIAVAGRLESCIREGDTVARLGGDEFVVILEDLDQAGLAAMQAESVARKILANLSQPYLLDLAQDGNRLAQRNHHCSSSIGITLFRDHPVTTDELMKRADTAMYQAKAAGRNTLRFFDPDMQAAVTARAGMEIDLRRAITDQQFLLYYQALVDPSGRVIGAEALLRWQHPRQGLVLPATFISLTEDSGLILTLGQWVLETACAQLAAWATRPAMAHLSLAVNVSALQFRHEHFVDLVLSALERTGANPKQLKLELTESLLVDDVEDIIHKMTTLKALGVSFSLDDFGTGYSSLAYLSRLPLDQLKIDRSFVMKIESDDNAAAICAATISLAHSLKLKVVAEGVETEVQHYFLNTVHHCDFLQGYLFSQALPLDAFEDFVKRF